MEICRKGGVREEGWDGKTIKDENPLAKHRYSVFGLVLIELARTFGANLGDANRKGMVKIS